MFGMGFMEILFIAIVAIIFLGPDKLPGAMVDIAKFIKSIKNAISDAKQTLNEEVDLDELKREAMSYKEELDKATKELEGFKNLNPMDDLRQSADFGSVKENFERIAHRDPEPTATQVEPKNEEVTFKKKTVRETTLSEFKAQNKALKEEAKNETKDDN